MNESKLTKRQKRFYTELLEADGRAFTIRCEAIEWRIAQALVRQGLIELVGDRNADGSFYAKVVEANIPDELRKRYRSGTSGGK